MASRVKFIRKAIGKNIIDNIKDTTRRVSRAETREVVDSGVGEFGDSVSFGVEGIVKTHGVRADGILTLWNLNEPRYFGGTPPYSHEIPPNALLEDNHIVVEVKGKIFNGSGGNRLFAPHLYLGLTAAELPVGSETTLSVASLTTGYRRFTYRAEIHQAPWWGTWVQVDEEFTVENVATVYNNLVYTDLSGGIGIIESLDQVDNAFFYMLVDGTLTQGRVFIKSVDYQFLDGTTNKPKIHWTSRQESDHVRDTYMQSGTPNTNHGSDNDWYVGELSTAVSTRRSLVCFEDLSNIPPNQYVIEEAYFMPTILNDVSANAAVLEIYPLVVPFVESEATWNISATATNWSTAGAGDSTNDYDGTTLIASENFAASETVAVIKLIDLDLDYMQDVIDGVRPNYGWLIKMQTDATPANNAYGFYSTDHANVGYRPQLHLVLRKL